MLKSRSDDLENYNLGLDDVISYLNATGWHFRQNLDDRLSVYIRPEKGMDRPSVVTLPAKETLSDYYNRLTDAIYRLADVEQVLPSEVIQKIHSMGNDVIRLRLDLSSDNLPSLEATSHFLQSFDNLLAYSARMEQRPGRYFERLSAQFRQQTERFKFAHTFRGSFGFTVVSFVAPRLSSEMTSSLPLERKIIERISRGLKSVKDAETDQSFLKISEDYEHGLNANMCSAVIDMLKIIQSDVEYSVLWSSRLDPSPDVAEDGPILLDSEVTFYLQSAADALRKAAFAEQEGDKVIEGYITELESSEERRERTVKMSVEDIGKVKFSLGSETYAVACDAHRDGLRVSVRGHLKRQGRGWVLHNPYEFKITQDEAYH